jgi:chaperonin cofactor prefoldin
MMREYQKLHAKLAKMQRVRNRISEAALEHEQAGSQFLDKYNERLDQIALRQSNMRAALKKKASSLSLQIKTAQETREKVNIRVGMLTSISLSRKGVMR